VLGFTEILPSLYKKRGGNGSVDKAVLGFTEIRGVQEGLVYKRM
jgi:hypothetical protein